MTDLGLSAFAKNIAEGPVRTLWRRCSCLYGVVGCVSMESPGVSLWSPWQHLHRVLDASMQAFRGAGKCSAFFTKQGVDAEQGRSAERREAAGRHPEEEGAVAHPLLEHAGHHAREHHPEGHEGGADGVVGRLRRTAGVVDEIEHVGREAEAVAELLDEDA